MVQNAETVFRDFVTDGVPASGPHKVKKAEARELLTYLEQGVLGGAAGAAVFASKASLDASLAYAANAPAWVIGDSTPANNGIYRKSGASGAGSWSRVGDLPYSFIRLTDAGAGTADAIVATSTMPMPAAAFSTLFLMNVSASNTGAVTVAVNGAAAKPLVTNSGNALAAGYLTAGMLAAFVDDGVNYRLITDVVSSAIVAAADAFAAQAAASAGLAAGYAAGVNLPVIQPGDAGKQLYVTPDETGFELGDPATGGGGLPGYVKAADYGTGYAALAAAWAVSKKIICTAGETYDFGTGNALTSSGEDVHIIAPASKFRLTGTDNIMRLEGGWEDIQAVSAVTSTTATVSNGAAFAVGDTVKIVDDTPLWHFTHDSTNGEFATIESIAGNVITFTRPLVYTYSVAATCRLGRIKSSRLQLDLGEVYVDGGSATVTTGGVIRVEAFKNALIHIHASRYCERAPVEEISCIGSHITVNLDTSPIAADGYGILVTSSEHGRYFGNFGRIRHSVVFIANNNFGTGLTPYGHSAYGVATVNVHGSGQQAFDFHHGTYKCGFVDSVASKCFGGVSFRGISNYVRDCVIEDCMRPFSAFSQYGMEVSKTDKSRIENCLVTYRGPDVSAADPFLQTSPGAGDVEIVGGRFELTGGIVTRLFEISDGGLTIRGGAKIIVSGGTVSARAILTEVGATFLTLDDVEFDFTGATITGSFLTDTATVTPLLTVNRLTIRGGGAYTSVFNGALNANSKFGSMHLPGIATLSSAVANTAFKPYLVGPVWFATNTYYQPAVT